MKVQPGPQWGSLCHVRSGLRFFFGAHGLLDAVSRASRRQLRGVLKVCSWTNLICFSVRWWRCGLQKISKGLDTRMWANTARWPVVQRVLGSLRCGRELP